MPKAEEMLQMRPASDAVAILGRNAFVLLTSTQPAGRQRTSLRRTGGAAAPAVMTQRPVRGQRRRRTVWRRPVVLSPMRHRVRPESD